MPGTKHFDFADFPLLFDREAVPILACGLPIERWFDLQVRAVGEFFDQYVRGVDREFPARLAREFEDLLVVHRPRIRS